MRWLLLIMKSFSLILWNLRVRGRGDAATWFDGWPTASCVETWRYTFMLAKVPRPFPHARHRPTLEPPTTPRQSSHIHGAVLLLAAQHYGEEINTRRGSGAELAAGTTVWAETLPLPPNPHLPSSFPLFPSIPVPSHLCVLAPHLFHQHTAAA